MSEIKENRAVKEKPKVNAAITEKVNHIKDFFRLCRAFNKKLDAKPKPDWIKKNPYSENALYIPIRIVESLLRSYFGTYQVLMVGEPKVIGNSIIVNVHLKVYHPIFEEWIIYAGTGAVPIQLKKDALNPLDFQKMLPKALHKNVPAALSFAVSNAAKKIGSIFGGDLNSNEAIESLIIF